MPGGGGAPPDEHPEDVLLALLELWLLLLVLLLGELSTYILTPWECCTCCTRRQAECIRALQVEHT